MAEEERRLAALRENEKAVFDRLMKEVKQHEG